MDDIMLGIFALFMAGGLLLGVISGINHLENQGCKRLAERYPMYEFSRGSGACLVKAPWGEYVTTNNMSIVVQAWNLAEERGCE